MVTLTESIITEFLLKYGERGKAVIKAALEISQEYRDTGKWDLGHFDFKGLVRKLEELGIHYNPSRLLRIMERDYGIIETSYRSGSQRWFTFSDMEAIKKVLKSLENSTSFLIDDPEAFVLELQVKAIRVDDIYKKVRDISSKPKLTAADKEFLKKTIFDDLPLIAKVLKETYRYDGLFNEFKFRATSLLRLLNKLIREVPEKTKSFGDALSKEPSTLTKKLRRAP